MARWNQEAMGMMEFDNDLLSREIIKFWEAYLKDLKSNVKKVRKIVNKFKNRR